MCKKKPYIRDGAHSVFHPQHAVFEYFIKSLSSLFHHDLLGFSVRVNHVYSSLKIDAVSISHVSDS